MFGLSKARWNPYLAGAIMGVLQIPLFFIMDATVLTSWIYAAPSSDIALYESMSVVANEKAGILTDERFFWHKIMYLSIFAGAFAAAWLGGLKIRIPKMVWSIKGLAKLGLYTLLGVVGGLTLYVGAQMVLVERFDAWQIFAGVSQLSAESYWMIFHMFIGGAFVALLCGGKSS